MTYTLQKLKYTHIMLEQAKQNSNTYYVFMANLDAFVSDARSVTLIMQKEFASILRFKEWYSLKQNEMKNKSDFDFFNNLRVDTTHVRSFNTLSKYTTSFPGGMTISGGKMVDIPFGKVDDMGNLLTDNDIPVTMNGEPVANIKRSTTRSYFFIDRPNEDAISLCEAYFQRLQEMVMECHAKFKLS